MIASICAIPLISLLFNDCAPPLPYASGYVEGEYVLIAPVESTTIDRLEVRRGDRVEPGQTLALMERRDAEIALAQAEAALAAAQTQLADLQEGKRPEEIRVIEASLASATAQAEEARRSYERVSNLAERGAATTAQRDDAKTALDVAEAAKAQIEANLAVARLPARPQALAGAGAAIRGAEAARDRAAWALGRRTIAAPVAGTIYDVIRSAGEIAGPSMPVLEMLPDGAVKLRLYVPETAVGAVAVGTRLFVHCDGCGDQMTATVTYVADSPEFTPPVIYSLENRQKLVYLIEARPDDPAATLKPGQIVDVQVPGAAMK